MTTDGGLSNGKIGGAIYCEAKDDRRNFIHFRVPVLSRANRSSTELT